MILPVVFAAFATTVILALLAIGILTIMKSKENEIGFSLKKAERILIFAPHQDDCVLMACTLVAENEQLGGKSRIVYLTQDEDEDDSKVRALECERAWGAAKCTPELLQFNELPAIFTTDHHKVENAIKFIQDQLVQYYPTVVVFPHFEGGHKHHDLTHYLVTMNASACGRALYLEAPLYSPYLSIVDTPLRVLKYIIKLLTLSIISYYEPPETIDQDPLLVHRCAPELLERKKAALSEFRSQNGDALSRNHGFVDRFKRWKPARYRPSAFIYKGSVPDRLRRLQQIMPSQLAVRILPGYFHAHGLFEGITDLDQERNSNVAK